MEPLHINMTRTVLDKHHIFRIAPENVELRDWIPHLSLLRYGLIEMLYLTGGGNHLLIGMTEATRGEAGYPSAMHDDETGQPKLLLPADIMDGWIVFYLACYTHEADPFEHVDCFVHHVDPRLPFERISVTLQVPAPSAE